MNLVGEWVRFTNVGADPIDLDGWEVADESASNRYRFSDLVLEPEHEVVVDYTVPSISLQPGTFAVSVTVADPSMSRVFDDRERSFLLHVRGGGGSVDGGLVDLGGRWSASEPQAGRVGG